MITKMSIALFAVGLMSSVTVQSASAGGYWYGRGYYGYHHHYRPYYGYGYGSGYGYYRPYYAPRYYGAYSYYPAYRYAPRRYYYYDY